MEFDCFSLIKIITKCGNVGKSGGLLLSFVVMIFQVAPKEEDMDSSNAVGYFSVLEEMEETESSSDLSLSS